MQTNLISHINSSRNSFATSWSNTLCELVRVIWPLPRELMTYHNQIREELFSFKHLINEEDEFYLEDMIIPIKRIWGLFVNLDLALIKLDIKDSKLDTELEKCYDILLRIMAMLRDEREVKYVH